MCTRSWWYQQDAGVDVGVAAVAGPPVDVVQLAESWWGVAAGIAAGLVAGDDRSAARPAERPLGPADVDHLRVRAEHDPGHLAVTREAGKHAAGDGPGADDLADREPLHVHHRLEPEQRRPRPGDRPDRAVRVIGRLLVDPEPDAGTGDGASEGVVVDHHGHVRAHARAAAREAVVQHQPRGLDQRGRASLLRGARVVLAGWGHHRVQHRAHHSTVLRGQKPRQVEPARRGRQGDVLPVAGLLVAALVRRRIRRSSPPAHEVPVGVRDQPASLLVQERLTALLGRTAQRCRSRGSVHRVPGQRVRLRHRHLTDHDRLRRGRQMVTQRPRQPHELHRLVMRQPRGHRQPVRDRPTARQRPEAVALDPRQQPSGGAGGTRDHVHHRQQRVDRSPLLRLVHHSRQCLRRTEQLCHHRMGRAHRPARHLLDTRRRRLATTDAPGTGDRRLVVHRCAHKVTPSDRIPAISPACRFAS